VARGETLSEIAARYDVSVQQIRQANRLNSDRLQIGQTLSIPATSN
jgi:N-acetylmuramoyl-L-alanine amidase